MIILHVVAPGEFGGLEQVVQALASGQQRGGHRVHVAALLDSQRWDHPFVISLRRAGVPVTGFPLASRAYLRERAEVRAVCRRLRPDIVHTHGYRPDVVDAPIARRLRIPTVTTVHGFTGGGWKNRFYERLQLWAFRRFDAVVAVSRPQARQLAEVGLRSDQLHVVPNAWTPRGDFLDRKEARRVLGVSDVGFRIGWVGRLTREKGADVLVDALVHLGDLPVAASILGDGRERRDLRARARALDVDTRIAWHGTVPEAARVFRAFDVFVLSSRSEGTPIALFEAMAAGVPVVAASVGGVPDVVTPAEALLVPPVNAGALAEAVRRVYQDPEAARLRVEAARQRLVQHFALSPWLARYEAIYRGLRVSAGRTP